MLKAVLTSTLLSLTVPAQYTNYEAPRWRVNGFAGFDLTHTQQSQTNVATFTNQLFPMGDVRIFGDGFILDPRLLDVSGGFEYQKGANQAERGDLGLGGTNITFNSAFLPKSHLPVRVSYMKTNHGVNGLGIDQNNDDSRLDVQWMVSEPKFPQITTSFQDYSSTVNVPTSLTDQNFSQKAWTVALSDVWKQWQWNGSYSMAAGTASGLAGINVNTNFDNNARTGSLTVQRAFWENKARLRFENREFWQSNHLGGDGTSDSSELTNIATFDVQVHPKVMLGTGYSFTEVDTNNVSVLQNPGAAPITFINFVSSTSNSATGRVDYKPFTWLRMTQEMRTTLTTPIPGVAESETSFTDTASTITADHVWRGFDLLGSYTGRFEMAGTTLENQPNQWSNSFMGRIGWGDVRYVHLVATVADENLNLIEQIGGFTRQKRATGELETQRVKRFRLRAGADWTQVEILNISGDTRNKTVTYSASGEHRLFMISYSKVSSDGVGAVFPVGLINPQILVVDLPINQLIFTPLQNRIMRADQVNFLLRPRRRLEAAVAWRNEHDIFATSEQTYNLLQADARYRIGKFTVEGGYSRNLYDVTNLTGPTGTRLAVWYFRIGRDFRVL